MKLKRLIGLVGLTLVATDGIKRPNRKDCHAKVVRFPDHLSHLTRVNVSGKTGVKKKKSAAGNMPEAKDGARPRHVATGAPGDRKQSIEN